MSFLLSDRTLVEDGPPLGRRGPERTRAVLTWTAAAATLGLLVAVVVAAMGRCAGRPPSVPASVRVDLNAALLVEAEGTTRLGSSWTFSRRGITAVVLSGPPAARGLALARLCPQALRDVEAALAEETELPWTRWRAAILHLLHGGCRWRDLPDEAAQELAGLALAAPRSGPASGRPDGRWAVCAAAPEAARVRSGWEAGEAAFCARVPAADSPLLACSLGDGPPPGGEQGRVVVRVRPEAGVPYLAVLRPGQFGVLCGVNQAGVAVVLLGARGLGPEADGEPPSFTVRRVLATATTLQEAVAQVREARLGVPGTFLLGSGTENAFTAVERTPRTAIERPVAGATAVWTELFDSPELRADPINLRRLRDGAPVLRARRLRELVRSSEGGLDPARCVALLRDRRGEDGTPLGFGHAAAVESCTSTLAVVLEPARHRLWVGTGPYALGEFVPFTVEESPGAPAPPSVPADPALARGEVAAYQRYRTDLNAAAKLAAAGRFRQALVVLQEVRTLNHDHYGSFLLAGRALEGLGLKDEARYNYEEARRRSPAHASEREEVDRKLRRLNTLIP